MTKQEAYGKLIKVAAKLLRGEGMGSNFQEDYQQKTYSRRRVAAMMDRALEFHRRWAVDIRDAVDALRDAEKKEAGG